MCRRRKERRASSVWDREPRLNAVLSGSETLDLFGDLCAGRSDPLHIAPSMPERRSASLPPRVDKQG